MATLSACMIMGGLMASAAALAMPRPDEGFVNFSDWKSLSTVPGPTEHTMDSYFGKPGCCGGKGGGHFDDWHHHSAYAVTSIYARGDRRLDHFKPEYLTSGGSKVRAEHGSDIRGPAGREFKIDYPNEWITGMEIRSGKAVDGFKVWTNKGRVSEWVGDYGGNSHKMDLPPKRMITGFWGRSGKSMDKLGFYFGPSPEYCNDIAGANGYWKPITSSVVDTKVTISRGTTHSYTMSTTETWSNKVTESVSAGFHWGKKDESGGGVEIKIEAEQAYSLAQTYSETFSESYGEQYERIFPGGQVWAWTFDIQDSCGPVETVTDSWVSTPSAADYPCCPAGYFKLKDGHQGHAPTKCTNSSLSLCK